MSNTKLTSGSQTEISIKELILILKDWFIYFKSKWIPFVLLSFIGTGYGLYKALVFEPEYKAELTLTSDGEGSSNAYLGLASQLGFDLGGGKGGIFSGDNLIELLKSRKLIENTLLTKVEINGRPQLLINCFLEFKKRKSENKNSDSKNELNKDEIIFYDSMPRSQFSRERDSALKSIYSQVKGGLLVERQDKKLAIIRVTYTSKDELFAFNFVNNLVRNTTNFYKQTKTQKFKTNIEIISSRLDSVKLALDQEMYGAAISKDQNQNVIRAQGFVQSTKKQMKVQILSTMYGELVKNLEMSKYAMMREEPLIQVIDEPILPLDKKKFSIFRGLLIGTIEGMILAFGILFAIRLKKQLL